MDNFDDFSKPLDNPKHERFAQAYASGQTMAESYRQAGYADDRRHASRFLATNGDVAARVEWLQKQNAAEGLLSRQQVLKSLADISSEAKDQGAYAPAVSALAKYAQICGFDAPIKFEGGIEHSGGVDLSGLDTDTLGKVLAYMDCQKREAQGS